MIRANSLILKFHQNEQAFETLLSYNMSLNP